MATYTGDTVITYLLQNLSSMCSFFLRLNGIISCMISGILRYSRKLSHSRLDEIFCRLSFTGATSEVKIMIEDVLQ